MFYIIKHIIGKVWCLPLSLALLSADSAAAGFNPDGRIGHPSIAHCSSWVQQRNRHSEDDWIYNGYGSTFGLIANEDKFDVYHGSLTVSVPANRYNTFIVNFNNTGNHGVQQFYNNWFDWYNGQTIDIDSCALRSLSFELNIFSRGIEDPADLNNPDGVSHSFVITPMMGISYSIDNDQQHGKHTRSGLQGGLKSAYIVANHLTIVGSYFYSQTEPLSEGDSYYRPGVLSSQNISVGFRVHLNNRAQSIENFSPDGSPGTVSIAPSIGYVFTGSKVKGVMAGTEVLIPITAYLSSYASFQYTSIEVKNGIGYRSPTLQLSKQSNLGFGITIHL